MKNIEKAREFIVAQIAWHESEIRRWYDIAHIDRMKGSIGKDQEVFEVDGHKMFGTIARLAVSEHRRKIAEYKNVLNSLN